MSKGYVKLWRCEEDIPALWENAGMFCAYQKLKIMVAHPVWSISAPLAVLARRMRVSVNSLRTSLKGLVKLGLIRVELTDKGITRITLAGGDNEPLAGVLAGAVPAMGETQAGAAAPKGELFALGDTENANTVSKFDTPQETNVQNLTRHLYQNLTRPLSSIKEIKNSKKTTTPYTSPKDFLAGFAAFWNEYPNKKNKARALARWKRGDFQLAEILPVLKRQKRLREWVKQDGQFVPRADAYLNQKRWQDELPQGEEFYVLDFARPATEREKTLRAWLEAVNPEILQNDNQKINNAFENDRADFEKIVALCGGNLQTAFAVMRHGWRKGCNTMRSVRERVAGYLDEMRREK